uniref:ATP synthase CFO B' chain subunit II n=1 Tax=Apophlaea sinclairii TaxID=212746 RepID=A0A1C9CBK8_9FLOR|nr:ATP synthase CFO B' chain subunit II [Apophlaea sinclairii]AOM65734.1 ATP synthase CFO B' chain subunit II [Apophlaea sinclairii]
MTDMSLLLLSDTEILNSSPEGGMFDFDATMPLMVLQFLILMVVLNIIFYKPISKILDVRDEYIRNSLTTASTYLVDANQLTEKYEQELALSRQQAQQTIRLSQQQAQKTVSDNIKIAQQEAQKLVSESSIQLNQQKEEAIKTLENQVDTLSKKIQSKLLISI